MVRIATLVLIGENEPCVPIKPVKEPLIWLTHGLERKFDPESHIVQMDLTVEHLKRAASMKCDATLRLDFIDPERLATQLHEPGFDRALIGAMERHHTLVFARSLDYLPRLLLDRCKLEDKK